MRWVFLLGAWLLLSNTASAGMVGQFMFYGNNASGNLQTDPANSDLLTDPANGNLLARP